MIPMRFNTSAFSKKSIGTDNVSLILYRLILHMQSLFPNPGTLPVHLTSNSRCYYSFRLLSREYIGPVLTRPRCVIP